MAINNPGRAFRRPAVARLLVAMLVICGTTVGFVSTATANVGLIVVDSAGDQADSNLSDGQCRTSAGTCTLRAAMAHANETYGDNTIHFAIPGGGVKTIDLGSSLPTINSITGTLVIDGYTQPGSSPNTAATGSNADIRIELDGTNIPGNDPIFNIRSWANVFRGLAAYGANVFDLEGLSANGNRFMGNFIGTNAAGTFQNPAFEIGIEMNNGPSHNVFGTKALADRNVMSGNGRRAMRINHAGTGHNVIQNNVIGLKPDLSGGTRQRTGIDIQWGSHHNMIGGFEPGEGNLISGHYYMAIDLSHIPKANLVVGNFIGTLGDGNSVAPYTKNEYALGMKDNPHETYVADNVMAGNEWSIWGRHNYNAENTYVNNRIGVGINGAAIPNDFPISLSGFADVWYQNIVGESDGLLNLTNEDGPNDFHRFESYTHRNQITQGQYYQHGSSSVLMNTPAIDINANGLTANDQGDGDSGVQDLLNWPVISGIGPGKVFGTACGGCQVEVYVSGTLAADGRIDTSGTATGKGLAWIATAQANAGGDWSLGDNRIAVGRALSALAIDGIGNTSELPAGQVVPNSHDGTNGNANSAVTPIGEPARPPLPIPFDYGPGTGPGGDSEINGAVNDLANNGVGGVFIDLYNEDRSTWLQGTSTDGAGNYQFDVDNGCYTLTFAAQGTDQFSTGTYLNQSACVTDGETTTVDAQLLINGTGSTTSLEGEVTDSAGAAVSGVFASLYTSDANQNRVSFLREETTDSNGEYSFDLAAPGCYVITLSTPNGEDFAQSGNQWLNLHTCVADGQTNTVGPSTVQTVAGVATTGGGTITNNANQPADSVFIDLYSANADGSRGGWLDGTQSDANGTFSIDLPVGGCYVFTYSAPNNSTWANTGTQWWNSYFCVSSGQTDNTQNAQLN